MANQQVTYWPDLKKYLADIHQDKENPPKPLCGICRVNALCITGINEWDENNDDQESTAVLVCGHMFGLDCIKEAIQLAKSDNKTSEFKCPICRYERFFFDGCDHAMEYPFLVLPSDRDGKLNRFPRTIQEGGNIPDECAECRYADSVEGIKQNISHYFYPQIMFSVYRRRAERNAIAAFRVEVKDANKYIWGGYGFDPDTQGKNGRGNGEDDESNDD